VQKPPRTWCSPSASSSRSSIRSFAATSGSSPLGTFDFTTGDSDHVASLVVFEISAEDGSRIHEVEIPLRTSR
jgi:hypothetical protein